MDIQPLTSTETVTADRSWLMNSHGTETNLTITLDVSKFTSGTHYVPASGPLMPYNRFKSGLPLGKLTASGLYAPYKSDATDGSEVFAGLLDTETTFNPTTTKVGAALRVHGQVRTAKLPVSLTVPAAESRTDGILFVS